MNRDKSHPLELTTNHESLFTGVPYALFTVKV
jgi:hypothetical protein